MSVTISADNSPLKVEEFDCQCLIYEPYGLHHGNPSCKECNGTGQIKFSTPQYEIQFSNTNFYSIMEMLGYEEMDCCGAMEHAKLGDFRQRVMRAFNSARQRTKAVRETVVDGNITYGGLSDQSIMDRLLYLDEVLQWAQKNNQRITWG